MVSQKAAAGKTYSIKASLYNINNRLVSQSAIQVSIIQSRNMRLQVRQDHLTITKGERYLRFNVLLFNHGNTKQDIVLLAQFPRVIRESHIGRKEIAVLPFTDTLITVHKPITQEMRKLGDFSVTVIGLYKNGGVFGRGHIQISAVKNKRKYRPAGAPLYPVYKNQFLFQTQYYSNNNAIYKSRLNTNFKLPGKAEINLNIRGNYRTNLNQLLFRNTWVDFNNNYINVKAGNLYKNYAINLNGRGGEFIYKMKNQNAYVEAGALDKSYRLFRASPIGGKSFWAAWHYKNDKAKSLNAAYIYDDDSFQNYRNMVFSLRKSLVTNKNIHLYGALSGGSTTTYTGSERRKYGLSVGNKLTAQLGKLSIRSQNFYSTGYYPGQKRGALNLNERLAYQINNYSIWGGFNHYRNQPKFIIFSQGLENSFSLSRAKAGFSASLKHIQFSFGSEYALQRRKLIFVNVNTGSQLTSLRAVAGINYFSHKQSLFLKLQSGVGKTNLCSKNIFQLRAGLNYTWNEFNLNANYQQGSFYLGEVLSNRGQSKAYSRWQISPRITHRFFNKKLKLTLGLTYAYNNFTKNTLHVVGRTGYKIFRGLNLFAGYEDYKYSGLYFNNQRLQFGLIEKFPSLDFSHKKHTLELFIYYDKDGNHRYSPGDKPAAGKLVYIDGKAFGTDKNGIVKYRRLPAGVYKIHFVNSSGWYAKDRKVQVTRNTKLKVGLHKMTTIKGRVKYSSTKLSYEINKKLGGLRVIATNSSGFTYKAVTNQEGHFVLYVPKGDYQVSLKTSGISQYVKVINNGQNKRTCVGTATELNFIIKVKKRKVIYKIFKATAGSNKKAN